MFTPGHRRGRINGAAAVDSGGFAPGHLCHNLDDEPTEFLLYHSALLHPGPGELPTCRHHFLLRITRRPDGTVVGLVDDREIQTTEHHHIYARLRADAVAVPTHLRRRL